MAMSSVYFRNLDEESKKRYIVKISLVKDKDPYCLLENEKTKDLMRLPKTSYIDMVNYLVYGVSAYTSEDFKAYKSLDSFNKFVCGWVNDVSVAEIDGLRLVMGKVKHSMRLTEKPLEPWFIAKPEGEIKCAHCTCMAGLGEACSHVAALMFFVQDFTIKVEEKSVTSVPAYWAQPTKRCIEFVEVQDLDFSNYKKHAVKKPMKVKEQIPPMTDEEFFQVLNNLNDENCNSAILNVVPPFNDDSNDKQDFLSLKQLFNEDNLLKTLKELQTMSEVITLQFTYLEASELEKETRLQSKSNKWFKYRAGRITASNMKSVCCTKVVSPAQSVIKKICYPRKIAINSPAIQWGCKHENDAKRDYESIQLTQHENFKLLVSGLFLNPDYPHLGATPDGLISCDCCGQGCLEVKCPFCIRNLDFMAEELKHECLDTSFDGTKTLSKRHAYYYQVQTQMFVCDKVFCDFVLWTHNGVFVERIFPDMDFWNYILEKSRVFFQKVILPEMLGQVFTKPYFSDGLPRHSEVRKVGGEKSPHVMFIK